MTEEHTSAATSGFAVQKPRGAGSLAAASAERGQLLNPPDAEFLLFYDSETTDLYKPSIPSDDPSQPHLVQLAASLIHVPTRQVVDQFCVVVKPEGTPEAPAWVSGPKALEAHGITTERAFAEGITELAAVGMLQALWERAQGRVAHNEAFDRRILRIAIMRYLGRDAADRWYHAPFNCTQFLASAIMQMESTAKMKAAGYGKKPKPPKLAEAHQFFLGRPLEGAHDAMNDVNGCIAVYFAIQDGVKTDQSKKFAEQVAAEDAAIAEGAGFGVVLDPDDVEGAFDPEPVSVHPDQIPLTGVAPPAEPPADQFEGIETL